MSHESSYFYELLEEEALSLRVNGEPSLEELNETLLISEKFSFLGDTGSSLLARGGNGACTIMGNDHSPFSLSSIKRGCAYLLQSTFGGDATNSNRRIHCTEMSGVLNEGGPSIGIENMK